MYLLESPRRVDSNKYTKHMFSWRIKWEYQWKNTRSADFCADQIDVITDFVVITNVVIKRVHCNIMHWNWSFGEEIHRFYCRILRFCSHVALPKTDDYLPYPNDTTEYTQLTKLLRKRFQTLLKTYSNVIINVYIPLIWQFLRHNVVF